MALNNENFNLYSSNEEVSHATAKIKIAFSVNNDGLIASGAMSHLFSKRNFLWPFYEEKIIYFKS